MPTKYQVEWFNWSCTWEWMGEFFMKSEAIDFIRSTLDYDEAEYQAQKGDFRIIVAVSF